MAQMNVSLPDQLKLWAEARVAEGRYSSTSDYMRDLIRRDQEAEEARRHETARLRMAWEEGLASGPAAPIPDDWTDNVIGRGRKRLAARSIKA